MKDFAKFIRILHKIADDSRFNGLDEDDIPMP